MTTAEQTPETKPDTKTEETTAGPRELLQKAAQQAQPLMDFLDEMTGHSDVVTIQDIYGINHSVPTQVPAINELRGFSAVRQLWEHPDSVDLVNEALRLRKEGGYMRATLWAMERAASDRKLAHMVHSIFAGFHADLEDGDGNVVDHGLLFSAQESARVKWAALDRDPAKAPKHVLHLFRTTQIGKALAPFLSSIVKDLLQWTEQGHTPSPHRTQSPH